MSNKTSIATSCVLLKFTYFMTVIYSKINYVITCSANKSENKLSVTFGHVTNTSCTT